MVKGVKLRTDLTKEGLSECNDSGVLGSTAIMGNGIGVFWTFRCTVMAGDYVARR